MPIDVFIDFSRVAAGFDVRAAIAAARRCRFAGRHREPCAPARPHSKTRRHLRAGWAGSMPTRAQSRPAATPWLRRRRTCSVARVVRRRSPLGAAIGLLTRGRGCGSDDWFRDRRAHRRRREQPGPAGCCRRPGDRRAAAAPARRNPGHLPRRRCAGAVPADQGGDGLRFRRAEPFLNVAGAIWHYMAAPAAAAFAHSSATVPSWPPRALRDPVLPRRFPLRSLAGRRSRASSRIGAGRREDGQRVWHWNAAVAETRLARALFDAYGTPPSLLLDLRNMIAGMNGTAMAALGISGGLHALGSGWDVTVLASKEAIAFHQLDSRFPTGRLRRSCRRVNSLRRSDCRSRGTSRK